MEAYCAQFGTYAGARTVSALWDMLKLPVAYAVGAIGLTLVCVGLFQECAAPNVATHDAGSEGAR